MGENFRKKRIEWLCRRRDRASSAFTPDLFTSVPPEYQHSVVGEIEPTVDLRVGDELHVRKCGTAFCGFAGAIRAVAFDEVGDSVIESLSRSDDLIVGRVNEVIAISRTVVVNVSSWSVLCR